jgi:hypothetical protein
MYGSASLRGQVRSSAVSAGWCHLVLYKCSLTCHDSRQNDAGHDSQAIKLRQCRRPAPASTRTSLLLNDKGRQTGSVQDN